MTDMKFWKEHKTLRVFLMVIFFVVGLALIVTGQALTGQMAGLVRMLIGVAVLLAALYLYNKPFTDPKEKHK